MSMKGSLFTAHAILWSRPDLNPATTPWAKVYENGSLVTGPKIAGIKTGYAGQLFLLSPSDLNLLQSVGSSTDNALVRWDGAVGAALQNSGVTLSDSGLLTFPNVDGDKISLLTTTIISASAAQLKISSPALIKLGTTSFDAVTIASTTGATAFAGAVTLTANTLLSPSTLELAPANNTLQISKTAAASCKLWGAANQFIIRNIQDAASGGIIDINSYSPGTAESYVRLFRECGTAATGKFQILSPGTSTVKFQVDAPTGNTSVAGTLGVTGATTLSSTLAVTGNTTLTGDLAVNGGDITSTSSLTLTPTSGTTYFTGDASASGLLWMKGDRKCFGVQDFKVLYRCNNAADLWDHTTNSNHTSIITSYGGGASIVVSEAGKFGNCLFFTNDSSDGSYFEQPNALVGLTAFSISFWIKQNSTYGPVFRYGSNSGTTTGMIGFSITSAYKAQVDYKITSSGTPATLVADSAMPNNKWTHYVITYNTTNDTIQLYENGLLVKSGSSGGDITFPSAGSSNTFGGISGDGFTGSIDEFIIVAHVMDAFEVHGLYMSLVEQWHPGLAAIGITFTKEGSSVKKAGVFTGSDASDPYIFFSSDGYAQVAKLFGRSSPFNIRAAGGGAATYIDLYSLLRPQYGIDLASGQVYKVNGQQVVGGRLSAVTIGSYTAPASLSIDPTASTTYDGYILDVTAAIGDALYYPTDSRGLPPVTYTNYAGRNFRIIKREIDSLKSKVGAIETAVQDIINRIKTTGGHGLVADS